MSFITNCYDRLLADISDMLGVPLGTPDCISDAWCINDAPLLDKQLLMYLEGSGGYPVFPEWLKPLTDRFFSLREAKVLKCIRQLLLFCYKIEQEPTNQQLNEAQASFENTDLDIECWDRYFSVTDKSMFRSARSIVGSVIYRINWPEITPSHGPGAVYPPEKPWLKSRFSSIYRTIEEYYPFAEYFVGLPSFWGEAIVAAQDRIVERETIVSRLVAVPKDSRGPRLICVHPKESIWIQQGCRRLLERAISHPTSPCHGRINFRDQGINGALALASSKDREYCTLDLKEASDRISCELVRYLFGDYAYAYMSCSRASECRLLDDRVIKLRKWAPMGNCLTFPVQSLIFYALVRAGIRSTYGEDCRSIYVFGDDILFPSKFYDGAITGLVRGGMIPNMGKTFRHGLFRESCGVDAFNGIDVTPHRLKRTDCQTASGALSLCSLAKNLRIDGFPLTSDALYKQVSLYWGPLYLSNNPDNQGICRYVDCDLWNLMRMDTPLRYNRSLHRWETIAHLVESRLFSPDSDAWWHLQDSLLKLTRQGEREDVSRELEYTVPRSERSKRGWVPVKEPIVFSTPVLSTVD